MAKYNEVVNRAYFKLGRFWFWFSPTILLNDFIL